MSVCKSVSEHVSRLDRAGLHGPLTAGTLGQSASLWWGFLPLLLETQAGAQFRPFYYHPSSPNYRVIIQSVDGWLLTHDWKPKNTISQLFCISQNRSPSVYSAFCPLVHRTGHMTKAGLLRSRPCLSSVNNKEEKVKHCTLKTSRIPTLSRNPPILAKIFWRKPKMNLAALKWCRNTQ